MPNKTIYIKDEDQVLFEKAQELGEDSLSSVIIDALRDFVKRAEKEQKNREVQEKSKEISEEIFSRAIQSRASYFQIQPMMDRFVVRFRVDGVMREEREIPASYYQGVIDHLKRESEVDPAGDLPREGSLFCEKEGVKCQMRTAFYPTMLGEAASARLLIIQPTLPSLTELEPEGEHSEKLGEISRRSHGLVLLTAPAGHGKTTTAYSMIEEGGMEKKNVVTIEDPAEYVLNGALQIPLPDESTSFATLLKSLLKGDPDVVFVGEIRDQETALLSTKVALAGHLVYTILHAPSAPGALSRMIGAGVPPYMLREALSAVVSQRLVRRLCPHCRQPEEGDYSKIIKSVDLPAHAEFFQPGGCQECSQTGFIGQTSLFEILEMTPRLGKALLDEESEGKLYKIARKEGMETLRDDGVRKAGAGHTSLSEVLRVLDQ